MRLLVDQDIYKITIDLLREWGHDLLTVRELGLEQVQDEDLLERAQAENRLLLTRDKGFGGLVFLNKELAMGVILLRMTSMNTKEVHHELRRLLEESQPDHVWKATSSLHPLLSGSDLLNL